MLHKTMECYTDDHVVKSKKRSGPLQDLHQIFEGLLKWALKMNPLKCAHGLISRKFVGFLFRQQAIKGDEAKKK